MVASLVNIINHWERRIAASPTVGNDCIIPGYGLVAARAHLRHDAFPLSPEKAYLSGAIAEVGKAVVYGKLWHILALKD